MAHGQRPPISIFNAGSSMPLRDKLNFSGAGVTVTDNSSTGRTDITIAGASSSGMTQANWNAMGIYRPQDYGTCDPTGVLDSRAAFQAAMDAVTASEHGGAVVCPPGKFRINEPGLVFWNPRPEVTGNIAYHFGKGLTGQGCNATTLFAGQNLTKPLLTYTSRSVDMGVGLPTANGTGYTPGQPGYGWPGPQISNITFINGNIWASTGTTYQNSACMADGLVKIHEASWGVMEKVNVLGYGSGNASALHIQDCVGNVYRDVRTANAAIGFRFSSQMDLATPVIYNFSNSGTVMQNVQAQGCSTWGIDWNGAYCGSPISITGLDLEGGGVGCRFNSPNPNVGVDSSLQVGLTGWLYFEGIQSPSWYFNADTVRMRGPLHLPNQQITNAGKTKLFIEDWWTLDTGSTVTNSSTAKLYLMNASVVNSTGGTRTVVY